MKESCFNGTLLMNVILLDDDVSPWSINFVKPAVMRAVESDSKINSVDGMILTTFFPNNTSSEIAILQSHN